MLLGNEVVPMPVVKTPPLPQGAHVDFALHTLGWKAFQDLAIAVAAEVLERPVQAFLPSNDGGRDGAFVGTWAGAPDEPDAKSTIQCKFTSKSDSNLSLTDVSSELGKIPSLAARGLAHDYVLLTNGGVSGERDAEISAACMAAGAKRARVLGRDWLTQTIRERPRLRMMVPRLYGLGDLSQIIDERAYLQARYILSAMGDDLAAFVTTDAHRKSVRALQQHGFVLLLGDPASGKSTIGASLALGALDDGAIGTVRISTADAFERHWNPNEPSQFFWIDDAFGETQYQRSRADGWNGQLRSIRAAVNAGARVLMTSRTYIWKAALADLKTSDFPLFENSKVIIDVQGLRDVERAQILYNHVRRGDQPGWWREELKLFLPSISVNRNFLPETARRLGSTFFTGKLGLNEYSIKKFVEEPKEILVDVLRTLTEPNRAAIALILLHGPTGVPSPVVTSEALDVVSRLSGVSAPEVARAMEELGGSLTVLIESDTGRRWTYKHPTIGDAYAALVAKSPEMVELYVRGAKIEQLLSDVVCDAIDVQGASVRVPHSLYGILLDRIEGKGLIDRLVLRFAADRADETFLRQLLERGIDLQTIASEIQSDLRWDPGLRLLEKFASMGLLPEAPRRTAVEVITKLTLMWSDPEPFREEKVRALFTDAEFSDLCGRFKTEIISVCRSDLHTWENRFSGDVPDQILEDLKEAVVAYASLLGDEDEAHDLTAPLIRTIDTRIEEIREADRDEDPSGTPIAPAVRVPDQIASIFDDVAD